MTAQDYTAITRSIRVTVHPFYLEDQSEPDENRFVWGYNVRIENCGREAVQLLRRTWQITDGRGRNIEVQGAGVVGEQPMLEAGESFEYTSGTPLETAVRIHARRLSHGDRHHRREFRRRHSAVQPRQPAPGRAGSLIRWQTAGTAPYRAK